MKALIYSDLHSDEHFFHPNYTPDVVITLGDILNSTLRKIDQYFNCLKLGIPGNHDRKGVFEGTKFINLHGHTLSYGGITFAGFGGCLRYNSKPYGQYTEDEAAAFLRHLKKVDVFISHSNPSYRDDDPYEHRNGFKSFSDFIVNQSPRFFIHGHLHEEKHFRLGETEIYSVYPYLELNI